MSNSGLLRSVTIVDEFGVLKSSKSMLLFSASVVLATSFHLLFYHHISICFPLLDVSHLVILVKVVIFFLFVVGNGYY